MRWWQAGRQAGLRQGYQLSAAPAAAATTGARASEGDRETSSPLRARGKQASARAKSAVDRTRRAPRAARMYVSRLPLLVVSLYRASSAGRAHTTSSITRWTSGLRGRNYRNLHGVRGRQGGGGGRESSALAISRPPTHISELPLPRRMRECVRAGSRCWPML